MNWAALRTIVFLWPATSRLFNSQFNYTCTSARARVKLLAPTKSTWKREFKMYHIRSGICDEMKVIQGANPWQKKIGKRNVLPGRESNPGLPRDRRRYLPLYYRGLTVNQVPYFVIHYISENIEGLRARLREIEVSRLFINRTKSVPGSLKVLVITDLIYYPFRYYPSKFVCKSCRFVRDGRNSIYCPILCIIRTRIKRTQPVLVSVGKSHKM